MLSKILLILTLPIWLPVSLVLFPFVYGKGHGYVTGTGHCPGDIVRVMRIGDDGEIKLLI